MAQPPGQNVFQLRAQLKRVDPVVWRRLLVPGSVRLDKLHLMLQAAMGWTNSHLHCFRFGDRTYGTQFDDNPLDELDETEVSVLRVLNDQRRFVYEYDFGDSWEHDVVVEDRSNLRLGLKFAVCLDGQNACPPEDCGGVPGYRRCSNPSTTLPTRSARATWPGLAALSTRRISTWPRPMPPCNGCAEPP